MSEQGAAAAAREIGEAIAEQGRHATEPKALLPWVMAFTYWPLVVDSIGIAPALGAAFDGYNSAAAGADLVDQDRGESWRMND